MFHCSNVPLKGREKQIEELKESTKKDKEKWSKEKKSLQKELTKEREKIIGPEQSESENIKELKRKIIAEQKSKSNYKIKWEKEAKEKDEYKKR